MAEFSPDGHVVLVGMMGSGKTTVGRKVARLLDRPFVDTDERIVSTTGREDRRMVRQSMMSRRSGTPRSAIIAELLEADEPQVIATGGGAVLRSRTRQRLIAADHSVVWLRASPQFLGSRMKAGTGRTDRPLLGDDPAETLARLDVQRRDFYAEVADVVVDVESFMREAEKPRKTIALLIVETLAATSAQVGG